MNSKKATSMEVIIQDLFDKENLPFLSDEIVVKIRDRLDFEMRAREALGTWIRENDETK